MKTLITALAASLFILSTVPASAQVSIDSPTLSAAVAPNATQITLSSVTCTGCTFGPGTTIYVDTEQMLVGPNYVSGTTVPVIRTKASAAHVNAAVVFVGPGNRFQSADPPVGACNKVTQGNGFYPWINIQTGAEWLCDNGQNAYTAVIWRVLYPYAIGTQAASR